MTGTGPSLQFPGLLVALTEWYAYEWDGERKNVKTDPYEGYVRFADKVCAAKKCGWKAPKKWENGLPGAYEAALVAKYPCGTPTRTFEGPANPIQGAGWYGVCVMYIREDSRLYQEAKIGAVVFCKEQLFNVWGESLREYEISGWPTRALRIVAVPTNEEPWTPMGVWRTVESEVEADYEHSDREDSYTYTDDGHSGR